MKFDDVHFSYIDNDTFEEKFVSVPEHGGGTLIQEHPINSLTMHAIVLGVVGHLGLYRLELQIVSGTRKLLLFDSGVNNKTKGAIKIAFDYFKANYAQVSVLSKVVDQDYHLHIVEIHNIGAATTITLCSFIAFCSGLMNK